MNRFSTFLGLLLAALALAAMACGGSAEPGATQAPQAGATPTPEAKQKTLRLGTPFLSRAPDPIKGGFRPVQMGLSETLFKLSREDLTPEPWLATGAMQLDETTWEVTLRQGVKFHNGESMDAAAVKASLDRAVAKSARAKALLDIAHIDVKDPSTLTITTNSPSPFLPSSLTERTTAIVDAAAATAMGDAFTESPVLTGPFKIEKFQLDKELVMVRHDGYWGPTSQLDRVIIIRLVDANSRLLALQSGDIDIAVDIAPESVVTVENEPELFVRLVPITTLIFMFLNHQREAVQDPLLRQAIASAIDRDALVRAVMQDQASVSPGLLPPTVIECPQLQSQGFDPAKAKQLLTQIGLRDQDGDGYVEKDGQMVIFTLLTYKQRPALPPMAEAIQSMLKAIGIKVVIRVVESPTTAVQQQSDWDGALWFGATSYIGEPSPFLAQWLVTSGAANYGHFSSPQFDQQVARMGQTSDRQKREKLACTAFQEVVDEVAVVPLLFPHFNIGVSRKVTGFEPYNNRYLLDSKVGKQ